MLDKLSVTFLIRLRILYAPASSMAVMVPVCVWAGGGGGGGRGGMKYASVFSIVDLTNNTVKF